MTALGSRQITLKVSLALVLFVFGNAVAKDSEQSAIAGLRLFEAEMEAAVTRGDAAFLRRALAEDFYFKHGSGRVDGKASWLAAVEKAPYLSRALTTRDVEMHRDFALTLGAIEVAVKDAAVPNGVRHYGVEFVRVYRRVADGWELVSHRTITLK